MLGTTDWLVKRFLKFVLKRNVGKYLSSEIDLEQLDVKLDTGKLELKNLLLNCDALNKDLTLGCWHVKAGYIGSVIAKLPLVSLSSGQCSVVVNEVMLTLAPTPYQPSGVASTPQGLPQDGVSGNSLATIFPQDIPSSDPAAPPSPPSAAGGTMGFLLSEDFGWTGQGAVTEGIKRIAGSLQSMLQHMRVEALNVLIRVELPHPTEKGRVVTAALKVDLIEFGDVSCTAATAGKAAAGGQQQQHPPHQYQQKASGAGSRASGEGKSPGSGPGTAAAAAVSMAAMGTGARREIAKLVQVKGLSLDLFETTPLVTGLAATGAPVPGSPRGGSSPPPAASLIASPTTATPSSPSPCSPPGAAPATSGPSGVTLVSGPGKHGLQLSAKLRMTIPDDVTQPTHIAADLHLGAVRLQLLPSHAVCLSALQVALNGSAAAAAACSGASEGEARGAASGGSGAAPDLWTSSYGSAAASMHSATGHWGRRSLLESIMLPSCEEVVVHSLEPYVAGAGLYGDASEFHDACSRFGSLASSLVSSVTQRGSDLLGYVAASSSAAVGGAMDWIGAAPHSPPKQPPVAVPRVPELQPAGGTAAAVPAPVATAGYAITAAAGASAGPQALPAVITAHAEVAHAAVVLCYSPAATAAYQGLQHHAGPGVAQRTSSNTGTCGRSTAGLAPPAPASRAAGATGGSLGLAAAAPTPWGSGAATAAPPGGSQAAGGSLVLELHDLGCELWLDAAHGNGVVLQAGQLQVYEQLPATVGAVYGMTPAEWARVPEVLPQAPHRFRPSQPSPSRASFSGSSSAGAALGSRLGVRPQGRNTQAVPNGATAAGTALQTWPVLSCACTAAAHSAGSAAHAPLAAATGAVQHRGGGVGNRPAAQQQQQAGALAGNGAGPGPGSGGHGCLRMRALWGSFAAPEYGAAAAGGYGRYGSDAYPQTPSFDLSLEVLPVTVWLSLPLIQRVMDFAAPLAGEAPGSGRGHRSLHVAVPRPAAPLPRLSLTAVAPHVCVLLALAPSSPPAVCAARPPGSLVFVALDIVSPPNSGPESQCHPLSPPNVSQPQQQHPHHPHPHQHPHQLLHGALGPSPYGSYGNPLHAPYPGGYAPHGPHQSHGAQGCGGPWGARPGHTPPASHYQHPGSTPPCYSAGYGPHPGLGGWMAPTAVPLLAVLQAPVTERLIPSQVTTIDLAPGVVELFLVRMAATGSGPSPAGAPQGAAAAAGPLHPVTSGAAEALSWTSKLLVSLHPSPPPMPPAAPFSHARWDSPPAAPPTGPWDVPPGCGLHLHVCSDPGVGSAEELLPEAWGHVAAHAQDRWADPDGEGGAWEERSSFRSVAFHERCRKSSANFVHLRTPKALVHLTRADLADLADLPSNLLPDSFSPSEVKSTTTTTSTLMAADAPAATVHRAPAAAPPPPEHPILAGPAPQTCALLEVCLTVQLQDEPSPATPSASSPLGACTGAQPAAAGGCGPAAPFGAPSSAAQQHPPPQVHSACGLGLGLGGSRVAVYELLVEELTVFRASRLGARAGCHVTSVHAHGVTLMGHLERPPHQQERQQHLPLAAAAAAHGAGFGAIAGATAAVAGAAARGGAGLEATGLAGDRAHRAVPGPAQTGPAQAHGPSGRQNSTTPLHGVPPNHGSLPVGSSVGPSWAGATPAPAICLLHCPLSYGAAEKTPSYIEYVCVEGLHPVPTTPGLAAPGARARGSGGGCTWARPGPVAEQPLPPPPPLAANTALHSVLLQGLTISTDHGYVTLDWAVQLGALFESISSSARGSSAPGSAAPKQPQHGRESGPVPRVVPARAVAPGRDGGQGVAGPKGRLSINIVDLALRHEPTEYPTAPGLRAAATGGLPTMDSAVGANGATAPHTQHQQHHSRPGASAASSGAAAAVGSGSGGGVHGRPVSPVALALIVEAIHFGLPLGTAEQVPCAPYTPLPYTPLPAHTVELHSMTLHLAAADQRGPGWGAGDPRAIREPLLQASGYHRVLQETSIKVVAKQRRYPRRPKLPSDPASGTSAPAPSATGTAAAAAAVAASRAAAVSPPSETATSTVPAATSAGCTEGQDEPPYHSTLDVEITNQHLLGMLTVESATLLAHFAMQAGTLMTARQAAAVASAAAAAGAAPIRRDGAGRPASGGPADLYWGSASEAGSSAAGAGRGSGVGASCSSEAGGDAAGSLLTALLLDEVEENAFRMVLEPGACVAAGSLTATGSVQCASGGWYGSGGDDGRVDGGVSNGLILIDDFFPVNHQGEYDEDLTLVEYPPKDARGGWRNGGKAELEGTWYAPDANPDRRPSAAGHAAVPLGYSLAAAAVAAATEDSVCGACQGSRPPFFSGVVLGSDEGLCGEDDTEGLFVGGMEGGVSEDPDIDDLLSPEGPGRGSRLGHGPQIGAAGDGGEATMRAAVAPSVVSVESAATRSSSAPTWRLQEDYVRAPRKSDEDGGGPGGMGAATGVGGLQGAGPSGSVDPLGGTAALGAGSRVDQPPPVARITFKDLSGIWVMHTTGSAASGPASGGSVSAVGFHAVGAGGTAAPTTAAAGGSPSGQQEGRVELVIEGLGLVLESYGPGGHLARHMKLTVHDLEIRDCAMDVRQQQAAAAGGGLALATAGGGRGSGGGGGWVRVLGYRAVRGRPRDSRDPLVAVALTAVRPNPVACDPRDEEFRLAVALLPLRLKLNQDVMSYLTWYGTSVSDALKPAAAVLNGMQAALSELGGCEPLPPPYFQRAQIRGFTIMLDYRPRRVDIGALAEGRLLELLNLVPLGGVDLACKPLRLAGVQGWDGLGAAVLREWLNDIARTQAHKFITGLAPVNAVVKVGSAVATLLAAPARHYTRRDSAASRQLATQLRRTSTTFATRLVCEALNAGKMAGKALARAGSSALGAAYGSQVPLFCTLSSYLRDDEGDEDEDGVRTEESEGEEGGGSEGHAAGKYDGLLYGTAAAGGASGGGMRRSRSASAVVRKGLARAAWSLGSASKQVTAGLQSGGLQRGMSNVARVLSAAAATGVSAAAPASAALQGQLQGTLRSVRRALRSSQLLQGGSRGGGGTAAAQPRLKED